jgi:hypothetical protein
MPLPGIALGPDVGGGIGAGLENVEPEMLQQELQKQQVQAGKMQLAADQNAMQQQQLQQMDAQAAYIAKVGRAMNNGDTNPMLAAQLNAWAQKRGLPSPVEAQPDGSFKINFDAVPGSGGMNDLSPADKAAFLAAPEEVRRIQWPGMSDSAYKAPQYIEDPKQRDEISGVYAKLMEGLGSGKTTPDEVATWLMTTPGAQSVISVPEAVKQLQDPAFQAETLGPLARAQIQRYANIGLSDKAKAAYENMMTHYLPSLTIARITHMQTQDKVAEGKLTVDQQNAQTRFDALGVQQQHVKAQIDALEATASKAAQYVSQHNGPMGALTVNALNAQSKTAQGALNSVKSELDVLMQIPRPTEEQVGLIQTLLSEQSDLTTQLQSIQANQGALAEAVTQQYSDKLGKGSGKTFKLPNDTTRTVHFKGQEVPGMPGATFTGEKRGNVWVFTDKDGNLQGWSDQ